MTRSGSLGTRSVHGLATGESARSTRHAPAEEMVGVLDEVGLSMAKYVMRGSGDAETTGTSGSRGGQRSNAGSRVVLPIFPFLDLAARSEER